MKECPSFKLRYKSPNLFKYSTGPGGCLDVNKIQSSYSRENYNKFLFPLIRKNQSLSLKEASKSSLINKSNLN